jgi:hypothetical protein
MYISSPCQQHFLFALFWSCHSIRYLCLIYIYLYLCVCMCIYIFICMHIYTYIYTYIYVCVCILECDIYITYICVYVYIYICVCIYIYIYMHTSYWKVITVHLSPFFLGFTLKRKISIPFVPSTASHPPSSSYEQQTLWAAYPPPFISPFFIFNTSLTLFNCPYTSCSYLYDPGKGQVKLNGSQWGMKARDLEASFCGAAHSQEPTPSCRGPLHPTCLWRSVFKELGWAGTSRLSGHLIQCQRHALTGNLVCSVFIICQLLISFSYLLLTKQTQHSSQKEARLHKCLHESSPKQQRKKKKDFPAVVNFLLS